MDFKNCSSCHRCWATREKFLASDEIRLIGYQPDFSDPGEGLFLFNHTKPMCGTTIALPAKLFFDLNKIPAYSEIKKGASDCGGQCLELDNLSSCKAQCAMAHIREIMQIILSR